MDKIQHSGVQVLNFILLPHPFSIDRVVEVGRLMNVMMQPLHMIEQLELYVSQMNAYLVVLSKPGKRNICNTKNFALLFVPKQIGGISPTIASVYILPKLVLQ